MFNCDLLLQYNYSLLQLLNWIDQELIRRKVVFWLFTKVSRMMDFLRTHQE